MSFSQPDDTRNFKTPAAGFGTLRVNLDETTRAGENQRRAFLNVIRSPTDLGVHVVIDHPLVIGRDEECDLTLHDLGVSRRHAIVRSVGNKEYVLQDLSSTNGTWINGSLVNGQTTIEHGQKIVLGESVLQFTLADAIDVDFHNEVAALVRTDPLTGLPSKPQFDQALEFAIRSAHLTDSKLSMLMMDLDGVKQINDSHGHLFGAYVIGEIGKLIQRVIGKDGQASRFGGDEFSAFLPDLGPEEAIAVAEQIRMTVEQAGLSKEGIPLYPTISIGVASFSDNSNTSVKLIEVADQALYSAKSLGKNRVVGSSKAA